MYDLAWAEGVYKEEEATRARVGQLLDDLVSFGNEKGYGYSKALIKHLIIHSLRSQCRQTLWNLFKAAAKHPICDLDDGMRRRILVAIAFEHDEERQGRLFFAESTIHP